MLARLGPAAQLLGLGWYVALCIAGGTVGGYFLDEALDTGKVFTVAGLALGLTLALVGGYRMLTDTIRDMQRRAEQDAAQAKKE